MPDEKQLRILKEGPEAWNQWREGKHTRPIPFSKETELWTIDLKGAELIDRKLSGVQLSDAHLDGALLRNISLNGANLDGASLQEAHMDSVHLHNAKLPKANLRGSTLKWVYFDKAYLRGANLKGIVTTRVGGLSTVSFGKTVLVDADLSHTDLTGADFHDARLERANLQHANLEGISLLSSNLASAHLKHANLQKAKLSFCHLAFAKLAPANLDGAELQNADLSYADLRGASCRNADFSGAKMVWAKLEGADLTGSNLHQADLTRAVVRNTKMDATNLSECTLIETDLTNASLRDANLTKSVLVETDLRGADLSNCTVYGISAWGLNGTPREQANLIVTPEDEAQVTVDDLEVAQFIYLILDNKRLKHVIDTITSKAVLILGRFTPERKRVLDAIRQALRAKGYTPILFDFELPQDLNVTETVTLLARMARFIIADLTDPASIPQELQAIVPHVAVPVQPLIEGENRPYSMSKDFVVGYRERFLKLYRYDGLEGLIENLDTKVITPAENRRREIIRNRAEALEAWD